MKTSYYFFVLMTCLVINSIAQTPTLNRKDIHIEASVLLGELQIENNPFNETMPIGYGVGIALGVTNKRNWGISVGVDYFGGEFRNTKPFEVNYANPFNMEVSSSEFFIENFDNSFSNYDIAFTLQFDGTGCDNPSPPPLDGETIKLSFERAQRLNQIDIPLKIEKAIGKKRIKFYLGIGAAPIFNLGDARVLKRNRSSSIAIVDIRHRCSVFGGDLRQFMVQNESLIFNHQNIIATRLDLMTEFGLIHKGIKSSFKFTVFLNESLSGFTQINDIKSQAQTIGIKFAWRKLVFNNKRTGF